jgi:hypothetical protein
MEKLSSIIQEAKSWVENNLEDDAKVVSSTLLDKKVLAKIYEQSSQKRPTVAVYGESQIGKSYLMSGLFKHQGRFFITVKGEHQEFGRHIIDGKYIDFLNSINPSGGRESSGIVTRFTSSTAHQKDKAPLRVEFLRQIDLAMILTDTYSMDFDTDDSDFNYENLVSILQEVQSELSPNQENGMSEDDVVEFKLYLQKYLKNSNDTIKLVNQAGLWDEIIKIIPRLDYSKRYKILEIFWGRVDAFTELFNHLSRILSQIDFITEANLDLHSIIPKKINGMIPASIIDVGTAKEVISKNKLEKRVTIYSDNGQEYAGFYIGDITALVKELTLSVDDRVVEQRSFLKEVDVLDFPGARNRKKFNIQTLKEIEQFDQFDTDDDEPLLHECLVRGKVNYLFNNYSDRLDITTLIFAQKYGNQEVNSLPRQIDNWVVNTHGASAQERETKGSNLFISFHFFNIDLDGKEDEIEGDIQQYEEYWNNRFKNNVEKFISQQIRNDDNWIVNWSGGKRFKNFLFLRDPAFQKSVTVENGIERYTSTKYQRKHQDMKESFITSSIVQEFVDNPKELWENSAELGKTGVDYIIQKAFGVTSKAVRDRQIRDRIKKIAKEVYLLIQQYYQSGDYSKVLEEAKLNTVKLIKELIISMQNYNSIGFVLDSLNIEESLAWKTMFDLNNPIFSYDEDNQAKALETGNGEVNIDVDNILESLGMEDELGEFFHDDSTSSNSEQKMVKRKSEAERFADTLLQNWEIALREKLEPKLQTIAISNESFEWLLQIIKESGKRVNLNLRIANANDTFIKQYVGNEEIIYMIARVAKNYLNKHINTVGWAYIDLTQRPALKGKRERIFIDYSESFTYKSPDIDEVERIIQSIFNKRENIQRGFNSEDNEIGEDFYFVGFEFFKEWLKALQEATFANVEFKFKEGGIVTNPEENDKLGKILEKIEQI